MYTISHSCYYLIHPLDLQGMLFYKKIFFFLYVSDMGVAIFYLLPQLLYNYFVILEWGEVSCKTYGYLHMTSFHISTNSIVVLTIDRLFVIVFPLSMMSKTRKYRYGLAMLSWLSGAIMSVPYSPHYDVVGISCKNNTPYIKVCQSFLCYICVWNAYTINIHIGVLNFRGR